MASGAEYLGVHPETLRRWVRKGKLAAERDGLRGGHPMVFAKADLDRIRISAKSTRLVRT